MQLEILAMLWLCVKTAMKDLVLFPKSGKMLGVKRLLFNSKKKKKEAWVGYTAAIWIDGYKATSLFFTYSAKKQAAILESIR